jgi:two-component system response regulator AtoC
MVKSSHDLVPTKAIATVAAMQRTGLSDTSPARLTVLGSGAPETHALSEGEVLIGRVEDADVRIEDDSISRRHAMMRVGERVTIEDLGSTNGTRVREHLLTQGEVVELTPGEAFEVGKVMCVLQRRSERERARRRIWPHGYFEQRLDEEIQRRERQGGKVTLARFHVEGEVATATFERIFDSVIRQSDLCGHYGPGEYEALFLDAPWEDVEEWCERLVGQLKLVATKVSTGVAIWPQDGRDAGGLLAAANAKISGARSIDEAATVVPKGAMERLRKLIDRVAKSDISIVLHGETGVGKEVMARELHKVSDRAAMPFVGLNCAALTETLLESELFGHERGAFSGAVATKPGLLEVAEKGTVFLDEIGEMSPGLQAKLLRVLEERQVLRVGGLSPRPIDVRFVAASHRDLEIEVHAGRFRQDLYFRLNGITLEIPPLRERANEIEGLASSFVADACRRQKRADAPIITREAMTLLKGYSWPGNIRELRNVVERAVLLSSGPTITPEALPVERMTAQRAPQVTFPVLPLPRTTTPRARSGGFDGIPHTTPEDTLPQQSPHLKGAVQDFERERILEALRATGGNQTKAAQLLGVSRRTLLNRLDQYDLPRPRKGQE